MVCMPIIPALGKLSQLHHKFEASLGYIERPCLQKKKPKTDKTKRQWKNNSGES
jgi:hypothetical protein